MCLLVSAVAGALTGAVAGWVKNRFGVHEALVTALSAWLWVYASGAALRSFSWQAPYLPELRLAALLIALSVAVLLWLGLLFTSVGLAVDVRGLSAATARSTGFSETLSA